MKYKVIAQKLNIRASASLESEVLRIVEKNELLDATSSKNGWLKLKGRNNGYVMEEYVSSVTE